MNEWSESESCWECGVLLSCLLEQYFNLFYLSVNVYGTGIYFYYNRTTLWKINNSLLYIQYSAIGIVHSGFRVYVLFDIEFERFCHLSFMSIFRSHTEFSSCSVYVIVHVCEWNPAFEMAWILLDSIYSNFQH